MQTKTRKKRRTGSTVRITDPALLPLCMKLIELGFYVWEKDGAMTKEGGLQTLCGHHNNFPDRIIVLVNNPPHFSGVILQDLRGVQLQAIPALTIGVVAKIAANIGKV